MNLPNSDTIVHRWLKIPYLLHATHRPNVGRRHLTVVFIHGIGSNSTVWQPIIQQLPPQIRAISIDLLGSGQSPHPNWPTYNASLQANSVIATLIKAGLTGPVIIVGHSLGSLIAIEIAKRYRFLIKGLILCSPPFYSKSSSTLQEKLLDKFYQTALRYPQLTLTIAQIRSKLPSINSHFKVDQRNIGIFLATLEASIVNQTALDDIVNLGMPIHIISGRLDPLVPSQSLIQLSRNSHNIVIHSILASHDITKPYQKVITNILSGLIKKQP